MLSNSESIQDFGLYMALKTHFENKSWACWPDGIKLMKNEALEYYKSKLAKEMDFYQFTQFIFFHQWDNLKSYANSKKNINHWGYAYLCKL